MEKLFTAYEKEVSMDTLMAYKATADPDTMYLHESMNQSNSNEFKKAIKKGTGWSNEK